MVIQKCFFIIIFGFLMFIHVDSQSNTNPQTELNEKLQTLSKNAPPELVYIQTNKDIYEVGEDLWFKAYLLDAQFLTPSGLSKTLYLQLLRESDKKPFWQEMYEIQDGFVNGHVYLESTLQEGNYLIAAYTTSSFFNDTSEFKATKGIIVRNDMNFKPTVTPKFDMAYRNNPIQFTTFPEGGNLVSGIESKVAFYAVNNTGEPFDVVGILYEDNTPLLNFNSLHAGMGNFDFVPNLEKKYSIQLTEPSIDTTFYLPEIYPAGMVMRMIERDKESLSFLITQNGDNKQVIYLRVQCRGVVCGIIKGQLSRELKITIPLEDLPQGIAEITLFNSDLIPVAERLVYVNPNRMLNITTELSREIYSTRGRATLKINVKDENGQPVVANLGVSVFDKLYQNPDDLSNILEYSYLTTQLKGRINNPSYYFDNSIEDRGEALEQLMLTQGWRRYVWNERELARYKQPPQQVVSDALRGEIVIPSVWKNVRQELKSVMAFSPETDTNKVFIISDPSGNFTIDPDLLQSWKGNYVYSKPLGPPKTNPKIKLVDPFEEINLATQHKEVIWPIHNMTSSVKGIPEMFETNSGLKMIDEITIRGDNSNMIRGKYMGMLDSLARIKSGDYVCRFHVLNCKLHSRYEEDTTLPVIGERYLFNVPTESGWGLVEIEYKGTDQKMSEDVLLRMNDLGRIKAYYGHREFYQPDYDKVSKEDILPDYRNTLLWKPSVITNEKGEATLSFFCSDIYTDFVGRIEGVSHDGLLGSESFKFTVRKLNINP